jgi:hypothetical protein
VTVQREDGAWKLCGQRLATRPVFVSTEASMGASPFVALLSACGWTDATQPGTTRAVKIALLSRCCVSHGQALAARGRRSRMAS